MKLLTLCAALSLAQPVFAADVLLSDDGTVLKLENTEDVAGENQTPVKPKLIENIEESDAYSTDPFGRACDKSNAYKPTS